MILLKQKKITYFILLLNITLFFFTFSTFTANREINKCFRKIRVPSAMSLSKAAMIVKKAIVKQRKFIVKKDSNKVLARPALYRKDMLLDKNHGTLTLAKGLKSGRFKALSKVEYIDSLNKAKTGIGITGGGDAAGIAAFLGSLKKNLPDDYNVLGVKNAGAGLVLLHEEFKKNLIVIDDLLAEHIMTQSSTPLGSARVDPLKENKENALKNMKDWGFFYGTGGDDHLDLLERISQNFPEKVVVGTFKSVDGDGVVDNKPAEMLGFASAATEYRKDIFSILQSCVTHGRIGVIEVFGRNSGRLAFHAASPNPMHFSVLHKESRDERMQKEEKRKIYTFKDNLMILVPEKPTTLGSIVKKVKNMRKELNKKKKAKAVGIVTAEGFMPPELQFEMNRLAKNDKLKKKWKSGKLAPKEIADLVEVKEENDPRKVLKQMFENNKRLAVRFAETVWETELDAYGNVADLSGIRYFIVEALDTLMEDTGGGIRKDRLGYEGRGVTPIKYDIVMGQKTGQKAAEMIEKGVTGGRAIVYFSDDKKGTIRHTDPFSQEPAVVELVGVSDQNNLNQFYYSDKILRQNHVFWKEGKIEKYLNEEN